MFLIFQGMNTLESLVLEVNSLSISERWFFGTKDTVTAAVPALNLSREQTAYRPSQS